MPDIDLNLVYDYQTLQFLAEGSGVEQLFLDPHTLFNAVQKMREFREKIKELNVKLPRFKILISPISSLR